MCPCAHNRTESYLSQALKVTLFSSIMEPMVTNDRNTEFSQRLNAVLDHIDFAKKGEARQKKLGELFNVGEKGARKWIESEGMPRQSRHQDIIEKLNEMGAGISGEWLFFGDNTKAPDWYKHSKGINDAHKGEYIALKSNLSPGPDIRGNVPLISWVKAGQWCETIDLYNVGDAESWLPCPVSHGPHTYCLRVSGDSMTNTIPGQKSYPEGTIIFVDPDRAVTNGCRVIAKIPGANEATFKEYREDSGKRYLKPLNQHYQMQEITDGVILCGVVIFSGVPE
jgi:SOS-response transcriptional repressor LexA